MKTIRLWGVITFFILALLLSLGWYFLAPSIIENGIEKVGSEALGAKVEVQQVELGLFPLQIEINGLQATDAEQPMKNLFEVEKINFAVDSNALLWKKVLIDELTLTGIQLGTSREHSGALEGGRTSEQLTKKVSAIELPEMTEDDIEELVNKANLITVKRLNELKNYQDKLQNDWKKALDKKAYKKRVAFIEEEFKKLSKRAKSNKLNLLKDRKKWKKLKKNIDQERKEIAKLNNKLKQDKKSLKENINAVRKGPKDDLNAIMGNMGLGNGVAGLSDRFLGPQFTPWIEKALSLTNKIKSEDSPSEKSPTYSTSKGQLVQFKDEQIFPDILIRKINLSGKDSSWEINGQGTNLGYFPWLVGMPAELDINLSGQEKSKANFSLNSNWSSSKKMLTQVNSKISNWKIVNMNLMQTEQGHWTVNSGQLNSTLQGQLTLEDIDLKLSITLNSPNIDIPENLSGWQKTLAGSLNQQNKLTVDVSATGTLTSPKLKVRSSLEKLFTQAIGTKVKEQANKYKGKITQAITTKVGDLSSLDGMLGDFDQWSDQLKGNDDLLKKLKGGI